MSWQERTPQVNKNNRCTVKELSLIFLFSLVFQYGLDDLTSGEGTVTKDLTAQGNCITVTVSPHL